MPISGSEILEGLPGGAPILHGSDLKKGARKVVIVVEGVRRAPKNFASPIILDIKPVADGKTAWAVNKTNLRSIVDKYGDDLEALVGKKITLHVANVNNPKTGRLTRSLFVELPE